MHFYQLISGAVMMGCWTVSLFFFRFWIRTREGLFGIFALAFVLLGLERFFLGLETHPNEARPAFYLIRLSAFILIIVGVANKNRLRKD